MDDLHLRPARPDELGFVADLSARSLEADLRRHDVWDPDRLRAYVERGFSPDRTLVVEHDGRRVGSVSVRHEADATWFELFYLDAAVQGRGLGTRVLRELLDRHGREAPIRIDVIRGSRARSLYERHGFVHESGDAVDEILVRPARVPATGATGVTGATGDSGLLPRPVLRPARADEFEAVLALKERVLRPDLERLGVWHPDRSREWAARAFSPDHSSIVELEGEPVGSISLRHVDDAVWIELFYLEPHLQGRGLGTAVLQEALARLGDDATVRLDVLRGSRARSLYLRHGFVHESEDDVDEVLVRRPR